MSEEVKDSLLEREFDIELVKRHTLDVHMKLRSASVAIAGLGGLGSSIAVSLARCGIGHLLLVDFDKVDMSNINRQQYYLRQIGMPKTEALTEVLKNINPYLKIDTKNIYVNDENAAEIFAGYDIVCEAFDRAENKAMLVNNLLEKTKVTVVAGSGMAGYLSSNTIQTKKVTDRFYICGDLQTDSADVNGLMAPRVGICANHQANMVIRLLLGKSEV